MNTVLYKPIAVNPLAYFVFPGLYELIPNTVDYIENCTYTGILEIHIGNLLVKLYENTSTIDLSEFVNALIRISLVTEVGSVLLGEWLIGETYIPENIRKNLVVWYDIARQGATNESMQANPVLKDLSGNGRDATCYNFAWSGMSGIGGRYVDVDKLVIKENISNLSRVWSYKVSPGQTMPEIEFSVIGLLEGQTLFLRVIDKNTESYNEERFRVNVGKDGTYKTPSFTNDSQETEAYEVVVNTGTYNFTIEFLPQYPGALVSDGVDDYAAARQIPIPTKETGYTIILRRELLTFDTVEGINWVVASNRNTGQENGAFCFEKFTGRNNETGYRKLKTLCFGGSTIVAKEKPIEQITWQTSLSYNGKSISQADSTGSPILTIGANTQNKNADNAFEFSNIALYSLLLFDRDLTDEEIEWVKTNLIEQ